MLKLNQTLRFLRVIYNLKQQELADKINISRSHLSEIEAGRKQPSLSLLERYSHAFNLPLYAIIFLGEMHNKEKLPQPLIPDKILTFHQLMQEIKHK